MDRFEELEWGNMQDGWVLLYGFLARQLMEDAGFDGEVALREGTRRFGRDRGLTNQKRLLDNNIKINLLTLYHEGRDRPGEPRFIEVHDMESEEEIVIRTYVCPMADVWKKYGLRKYGRIYCEEFHYADYDAYSFGTAKINVARSLTQEGDDRCVFNHTMRPENMTPELRKICFARFDPDYVPPKEPMPKPQGKSGFDMLWIKTYYYILEAAVETLGDPGIAIVQKALRTTAHEDARNLIDIAERTERAIDRDFLEAHIAPYIDADNNPLWNSYSRYDALPLAKKFYFDPLFREVNAQ